MMDNLVISTQRQHSNGQSLSSEELAKQIKE